MKNIRTAKEKNARKALAWMSGCLFWNTLTKKMPPMMNMNAVSVWVGVWVCVCVCVGVGGCVCIKYLQIVWFTHQTES